MILPSEPWPRRVPVTQLRILVGEVVGRGPDHEPLVGEFVPLGWLSPAVVEQAYDHYQSRFDVGRSSR